MPLNHTTAKDRVFDGVNIVILLGFAALTILPFLYVLAASFATESEIAARPFFLWPENPTLETYRYIFSTDTFVRSLLVTIGVTVVGTVVQIVMTLLMAYPLSDPNLVGRGLIMRLVLFAMLFSGGMIPLFLVIKQLGLLDSYWALILPLAINPFNLIVIRTFFQQLPGELREAAEIDGANEFTTFWRIMLPLSKPVIATFSLFYAVGLWNDFMSPLLYISDSSKWTLQMFVRQVTISTDPSTTIGNLDPNYVPPAEGLKFAVIVIATLPIMCIYPFLQKHFAKGVMIGSVKG
ncbi:carbohydrate ABC transporter permease [Brachybacterium sp. NBEC-018]|uniref:carbohydrate ABC transporter permease n=1 Tax=Brachybacterium sp. NBEC-018 TaxID=2996004 RepID=UPI0021755059|nr:carbohydrate ABC transporter permease [Brachybacterium sp. NBEC-018]UVY84900.1 carbohydrate ABC transporter permease [Brachybacterium sp. NBEC-018]